MTLRRGLLLAGAALCLAVAAIAALGARDAGAWQDSLRAGDVAAAAQKPTTPSWDASEAALFGLARRLLGVDDDLAFRRGVALFRRAHTGIPSFDTSLAGTALRIAAEAALAREIRTDSNGPRASTAANLLGVLSVIDATSPAGSPTPIERSIFEFEDAIHLDTTNEQAKTNLELLYQLTAPPNTPQGSNRRQGRSHAGASASSPGHGY
jgi:hypothetical protein